MVSITEYELRRMYECHREVIAARLTRWKALKASLVICGVAASLNAAAPSPGAEPRASTVKPPGWNSHHPLHRTSQTILMLSIIIITMMDVLLVSVGGGGSRWRTLHQSVHHGVWTLIPKRTELRSCPLLFPSFSRNMLRPCRFIS